MTKSETWPVSNWRSLSGGMQIRKITTKLRRLSTFSRKSTSSQMMSLNERPGSSHCPVSLTATRTTTTVSPNSLKQSSRSFWVHWMTVSIRQGTWRWNHCFTYRRVWTRKLLNTSTRFFNKLSARSTTWIKKSKKLLFF